MLYTICVYFTAYLFSPNPKHATTTTTTTSTMSWESAANVLYADSPTLEQIDALQKFVNSHSNELTRCYAPEFKAQRPVLCKFVARLFVLLEKKDWDDTKTAKVLQDAVDKIADLLARENFFTGVFHHALSEGSVHLLELVDWFLFTEIVFDSDLTRLWFEEKRKYEHLVSGFSSITRALITIISVQFLDVRQDWSLCNPSAALLTSLNSEIYGSQDQTLKLVWNLALYYMAQSYYTSEQGDDAHGIESVMRSLQARAGVHWSEVLRDQLQMSLPGVNGLVQALEVVELHKLDVVDGQLLAQTVADVISCLFAVSKPTETLCAALAMAVSPWPALQRVSWVPEEYIALTKAKAPASIEALVSLAETMDTTTRYEYLREMRSYVSVVDAENLDIESLDDSLLGGDVRTTKVISVLPPRPSDNQGTLELEPGTRGTLLAFSGTDCLVMWYFTYNGWSLLGRILENNDLNEGDEWSPVTIEILKLVTMTLSVGVQTVLSAGLARGDIVDLMAARLQSWIHSGKTKLCGLAFAFFAEIAKLDPSRVWVLMATFNWSADLEVLAGAKKLLLVLWPFFDPSRSLHQQAAQKLVILCAEHYSSAEFFDNSVLQVFEYLLPVYKDLQEDLLGASSLRETAIAPLLANMDSADMLNFCTFCVKLANSFERTELSYLEKRLFSKSKELAQLFKTQEHLRSPILQLWTALVAYPEAPPLLAFLDEQDAQTLKKELLSILDNKLEPVGIINNLALFMISARRQESLIVLLWGSLMPLFESRANSIEDPVVLSNILKSLTLLKGQLGADTLRLVQEKVRADVDPSDNASLQVKIMAIRLLSKQVLTDPAPLAEFIGEISQLIPKLTKIEGVRPSLHSRLFRNMSKKWPAIIEDNPADSTSTFELDLNKWDDKLKHDPVWKSSYRSEMVEAINNKVTVKEQASVVIEFCDFVQNAISAYPQSQKDSVLCAIKLLEENNLLLPTHLQISENKRTETALVLLNLRSEPSIELLDLVYHQLMDIVQTPSVGLQQTKKHLVMLMQIAALVLATFPDGKNVKLKPILLGLLDVVVIKQLQMFGSSEETLRLHLLLLRQCLHLLNDPVAPRSLVQSMTESGSDTIILNNFMTTPVDKPFWGELLLLYIQEWLPADIMTDNFVRNGLMNVLIEAPLARAIQGGDVIANKSPKLHSLWRQGLLTVVLRLLKQLGSRIAQESWLFIGVYSAQIATCQEQWKGGQISLGLIEETLLIHALLQQLTRLDNNPNDRITVSFEELELVRIIDVLLSHRKYLVARTAEKDDPDTIMAAMRELKQIIGS